MADAPAIPYPATLKERIKVSLDFFRSKGWSGQQAAGMVANLVAESNILPNAAGDNGTASGIAQWHPARQAAFQAKHNKPLIGSSLAEQLEFVNYELSSGPEVGAGNKLKSAKTAADAGAAVSKYYERPLNKADEATARGQKAASIYNEYVEKSEAKLP